MPHFEDREGNVWIATYGGTSFGAVARRPGDPLPDPTVEIVHFERADKSDRVPATMGVGELSSLDADGLRRELERALARRG